MPPNTMSQEVDLMRNKRMKTERTTKEMKRMGRMR